VSLHKFVKAPLALDELEAALDQCNNSCPGLDGLRSSLLKALPMEAKLCLLDIYNGILATGAVPQSWHRTRLNFCAEKNGILSPTQYGFRKGKGTRDCLVMLMTDITTSFEMKKQTVAAFLEISWAYDNVLIDVLYGVMLEKELPLGIVRFMWSLLWCKILVFCVGGAECMTLI
jgi:hypothetical protein